MEQKRNVILFDIDHTIFDTEHFKESGLTDYVLYEDVQEALLKLREIALLGIFSTGEPDFQTEKLLRTGIYDHFFGANIHISERKEDILQETFQRYENDRVFYVDNWLEKLYVAKQYMPSVFSVLIKRPELQMQEEPIHDFSADVKISNLHELVPIVKSGF